MNDKYLNELSKKIHESNTTAGWWDGEQCLYEKIQLVSTEIAEATEGARKSLMDDHLPQYPMEQVELADALIRALDLGGRLELTYEDLNLKYPLIGKENSVGANHLGVNCEVVTFAKAIYLEKTGDVLNNFYSAMVGAILRCAKERGYNLAKATAEKLEYNLKRADHKPANRAKKNGKSF